jgi:thymidylate synthase
MNKLDKQYIELLQDILDNGYHKDDRTGTGTISVFGRYIRHKMSDGFPLLTTKKMSIKSIMTELKWFLKGDTNIQYLVQNGCNIWNGDAYKNYLIEDARTLPNMSKDKMMELGYRLTQEDFINKIKTDDEFAQAWGELGPIYGKQWRKWDIINKVNENTGEFFLGNQYIDQIKNVLELLKTNPDSRRIMVNAWNVGEIEDVVLPPCHYGFQFYTRELSFDERKKLCKLSERVYPNNEWMDENNIPKREISLLWNQRSVDTPLGLPFNIASYGMLLLLFAEEVNMVPGELIGNLGDTHIYKNQVGGCIEQIGRELTDKERTEILVSISDNKKDFYDRNSRLVVLDKEVLNNHNIPKRTREPFKLPTMKISNVDILNGEFDYEIKDYESHPTIKFPLSN